MSDAAALWVHEDSSVHADPNDLTDYKVMCFGGKARCEFTCTGRTDGDLHVDFFDTEWNHLPFTRHYPNANIPPEAPLALEGYGGDGRAAVGGHPFRVCRLLRGGRAVLLRRDDLLPQYRHGSLRTRGVR